MATITASSFASTSSHVSYGAVSSGSNPKTGFKKMSFGKTDPDSQWVESFELGGRAPSQNHSQFSCKANEGQNRQQH
ncbi:hypothetical protein ACFX2I_022990 [Malus domestica]